MSDLTRLVRMFEASEEASQASRREGEKARDYFDGNQLTAEERRQLRKRRQPDVTENLIRPKVDSLCGLERQSRTDPKAYPRNDADDSDAFAVTDALRYVAQDQRLDIKRSAVFQNLLVEGMGGVEVGAARVRGGIDPALYQVAWDRIFHDPHSAMPDFSDAAYVGYITWMDVDKALASCRDGAKWAGKSDVIQQTMTAPYSSASSTYDDKPRWCSWGDSSRKRIRVNTIYYEEGGVWYRAVYTLAGELEPCAPSPFLDEDGQPECALILASAYVDRDNDRYGIVRDFIPLQDEVNKRRSKFLHHVSSRAVRVGTSTTQDAETIRREVARPDGVVIADNGEVEVIQQGDMAAGQFQLLMDTRSSLKAVGPNAYLQGKAGQDQSGRAILAQQQAGMTEMAPLLDNLRDFNRRVYRAIWNRIRQFWDGPRWVRVTDDEKNIRFVGLNVTRADVALRKVADAVRGGVVDQQTAAAYQQQIRTDPSMMAPANVVAEMDVDIDIEEVPDSPTLQADQFNSLLELAKINPEAIPIEDLVRASSIRDKEKIIKGIEDRKAAASQPNPMQELEVRSAQAEVAGKEAHASLMSARAEHEQVKPVLEALKTGLGA
jgi:hypothetical protein